VPYNWNSATFWRKYTPKFVNFKLEFTSALQALNNGLNKFLQPLDGKDVLFGTQNKINNCSMLPVVKLCPVISSDYSKYE
jgi:hypothetical protein